MRIVSGGHAVFAATLIAIGVLGLIQGDFAPIWDGVSQDLPARGALAFLCACLSLGSGIALCWRRTAAVAARVLFVYLLLWMLVVKVRIIVLAPLVEGSYQSCGENAVLVAGAWILDAWFNGGGEGQRTGIAVNALTLRYARMLYALALIAFGLSHFVYLNLTAPLVPGWLPAPRFWTYVTGAAYLAAGAAILINVYPRLATVFAALQIGLLLVLVWLLPMAAGHVSVVQGSEAVLNGALLAGAWVVADSYRDTPWFAAAKR